MMIDTHTHIYGPEFDTDRKQVVERALQAGVTSVILPNVNLESLHQIKEMCADYPNFCHAAVGLHPEDVREDFRHQLRWVREELQNSEYIAVGEIGIDLYWDKTFLREQVCAFQQQVEWTIELDLPLIIHTRNSHAETLQALSPYKNRGLRGVFHCFTGDEKQANEIFEAGEFVIGIGGVLTFKKSPLPAFLSKIPLDKVVLETDAPYLTPVPYRGKRNEPAYLTYILQKMAEIYSIDEKELQKITTDNAKKIFRI